MNSSHEKPFYQPSGETEYPSDVKKSGEQVAGEGPFLVSGLEQGLPFLEISLLSSWVCQHAPPVLQECYFLNWNAIY